MVLDSFLVCNFANGGRGDDIVVIMLEFWWFFYSMSYGGVDGAGGGDGVGSKLNWGCIRRVGDQGQRFIV